MRYCSCFKNCYDYDFGKNVCTTSLKIYKIYDDDESMMLNDEMVRVRNEDLFGLEEIVEA